MSSLPEPLQLFDPAPLTAALRDADLLQARYREAREANRILPNTFEAVRVELTYHSNAIEGNTLSLRDTQLVIDGLEPNSGKTLREIYETRNHDRALRKIESWAAQSAPTALTEPMLLDIHAEVLADIDPRGAGRFRTDRVLIKGTHFVPPGSHKFPTLIPALLALAGRSDPHPIVQAAELHYNLVAVHPFNDGNGRTARLAMNYHLLRYGFPLTIIPVEKRRDYLTALEEANAGSCAPFAAFVLQCVRDTTEKLIGEGGATNAGM